MEHDCEEPSAPPPSRLQRANYYLGIGLLLLVVFLWTSSNFVTQDLFEDGFVKPFLITYLNTSAFSLYLIPWLIRWVVSSKGVNVPEPIRQGYEVIAVSEALEVPTGTIRSNFRSASIQRTIVSHAEELQPLTKKETAKLALFFCLFWFIANWSVNASLEFTSVASSTILASMSGFFTLAIGKIFGVESLTFSKIAAVTTSFLGVILVSLADHDSTQPAIASTDGDGAGQTHREHPLFGDSLALLSALFYAIYVVLLKIKIKEESRIDMQLFFGFVGLFNTLLLWPLGLVLHFTGVETLELPPSGRAWAAIFINMFITFSSDFIYVIAMLKTTPVVVTVGLSLTIPLAILGDFFLSIPTPLQGIFGGSLVLLSFVIVGISNAEDNQNTDPPTAEEIMEEEVRLSSDP